MDKYCEAVHGRRAVYWDSVHQVVNSQPCECDNVTIPLSNHGELADDGRSCWEPHQKLTLHSEVNSYSWKWREDKQSWVYAVLGISCTRYQLLIMTWREWVEWLSFVFCDVGIVVDEKERDRVWRWEQFGQLRVYMRNLGYEVPDWV